ncbi:MAG: glycoside hydrolase family 127 protein [Bacteroidales bacterium]|nr:glycoside hydrolase family 127 protein [Bacteroidales bacterium]
MSKSSLPIFVLLFGILIKLEGNSLKDFELENVNLLPGSAIYQAEQADLKYLLALDPDRLLAPFLKESEIKPLKPNYPNWESMGLDGHTAGHYLSAISMMYAITKEKLLLERIKYMLSWLDSCQQKNGDGYVGGIPDGKSLWNDIRNGKIQAASFSLGNRWVPLYNLHKTFAGLRDAYLYAHQPRALDILIKLTDWFYNLTQPLSDEQIQQILATEHGGLNEVFTQVGQISGNKKYINLAQRFSHRAILQPLIEGKDMLSGLHANTQIPKVIGFKCVADATQNPEWDRAAQFFWDLVVEKYSVSFGGHGVREHFNPPTDFSSMIESNQGPETCNSYNMLKLTKLLFLSTRKEKYIDYYERTLFNHILSSINRDKGGFVYFTPIHPCHYRVYSTVENSFWCCVGTGMENHAKYGELIYAHTTDTLWVNLFIASRLYWKEKQIEVIQQTNFPNESLTKLRIITPKSIKVTLRIRKPAWIKSESLEIQVNKEKSIRLASVNGYIEISRQWKNNDIVTVSLPQTLSVEYLPDSSHWASVLYGPIVLAAACDTANQLGLWADDSRMAHVANGPLYPIDEQPYILANDKNWINSIKILDAQKLIFSMPVLTSKNEPTYVQLRPFYELQATRYTLYFPVLNQQQLELKQKTLRTRENERLALQQRTIDEVAPGEQQSEVGHNFKGENTEWGINQNRFWRHAFGWFSYELADPKNEAKYLSLTFFGLDNNRTFDVWMNDIKIATICLKGDKGDRFFDQEIEIPKVIRESAKGTYTVKFVPENGSLAGGIYYIRLLR